MILTYTVREYAPSDETSWLRCRVLAFLDTSFYDSVVPAKPALAAPGLELVAVDESGTVVAPRPGLRPMMVFLHAPLADEQRLRGEFARVHVERRFSMPL